MQRPPQEGMPGIREVTRMVARLGGFLGRKNNGEPGSITLTRGLHMLHVIATSWVIFTQSQRAERRRVRTARKRPVSSVGDMGNDQLLEGHGSSKPASLGLIEIREDPQP
jgi:Transposase Tn5 dimerisation domain